MGISLGPARGPYNSGLDLLLSFLHVPLLSPRSLCALTEFSDIIISIWAIKYPLNLMSRYIKDRVLIFQVEFPLQHIVTYYSYLTTIIDYY